MSDQPAMRADSQPPQNAASAPPVPDKPQWAREFEECWKACREQLEARVVAAGRVA